MEERHVQTKRPSEIFAEFIDRQEEMNLTVKNLKDRLRILEEQVSLLLNKIAKE